MELHEDNVLIKMRSNLVILDTSRIFFSECEPENGKERSLIITQTILSGGNIIANINWIIAA